MMKKSESIEILSSIWSGRGSQKLTCNGGTEGILLAQDSAFKYISNQQVTFSECDHWTLILLSISRLKGHLNSKENKENRILSGKVIFTSFKNYYIIYVNIF